MGTTLNTLKSGFAKLALGALVIGSAALLTPAPAKADVSFGIGVGVGGPGYYGGYSYRPRPYRWSCEPYSRYYDPYYCRRGAYYDDYYDTPLYGNVVFYGGNWYRGPFRSRYYNGHNWYWVNNGWRRNEWRGNYPRDIRFRNGGWYRDGRYGGFNRGRYDRGPRNNYWNRDRNR